MIAQGGAYTVELDDTTIQQMADSAIRKCARGEIATEQVVPIYKYGQGRLKDGRMFRGLVEFAVSVKILQPVK